MNPGAFVAGGGGDGGGKGGKGSGNGNGNEGADGADGDENAEGEGNSANACGEGDAGACANPAHGGGGDLTEGDPVDAISGRVFTTPSVELLLASPVPLVIRRQYSSDAAATDIGLGHGWSHSLAWEMRVKRRSVTVLTPTAQHRTFKNFRSGDSRRFGGKTLVRLKNGFILHDARHRYLFAPDANDARRYRLVAIQDSFGNRTRLDYSDGRLVGGEDCVGRIFRVVWDGSGHISAFETFETGRNRWKSFFRYAYDDGDLVRATDALGNVNHYVYERHRLVQHTSPTGRAVHYRYDAAGRCFETWVDYPGAVDLALDDSVPEYLADGTTPALGMYHCRFARDGEYVETTNSRQSKRATTNGFGKADVVVSDGAVSSLEYDDAGRVTAYLDGLGNAWRWLRDSDGRVLEETNPVGAVRKFEYNPAGHLVTEIEPDGYVRRHLRDAHGYLQALSDDEGDLIAYEYDARGNCIAATLPNGARARMAYDQFCNRIEVREIGGEVADIEYNHFGKPTLRRDGRGGETRFYYDEMLRLVRTTYPNGDEHLWSYDGESNLTSMTKPDGSKYEFLWGGVHSVHGMRRPDGTQMNFRYDREGNLVRVINEKGEEHVIQRDVAGRVRAEHTFDGRKLSYQLDLAGNLVRMTENSGQHTDFEYDAAGRIINRAFPDETSEAFEYDLRGRLMRAEYENTLCTFEYDRRGQLVKQTQSLDGVEESVTTDFDTCGNVTRRRTSFGHEELATFDVARRRVALELLGGAAPLAFDYDEQDHEVSRVLPGGGKILHGYDGMDRLVRREFIWGAPERRTAEPEWVGAVTPHSNRQTYGYSLRGLLNSILDSAGGVTQLTYDRLARLVEKKTDHGTDESFGFEPNGNMHQAGVGCRYAAGGRLLQHGNTTLEYDLDGRVVRRRASGGEDWTYEWDGRGYLRRAIRSDHSQVEFEYDALGRRLRKRCLDRFGDITSEDRFVWDQHSLIHELRSTVGDQAVQEEEVTYVYGLGGMAPLAHRRAVRGAESSADWVFYVNDAALRPEYLLNGKAEVLSHLEGAAYGAVVYDPGHREETPLRFAGHYADGETGLHNNHYRHYDPETGVYLSPEPLGIAASPRPYGYAFNDPIEMVDPDGLAGMSSTATDGNVSGQGYASGTRDPGNRWRSGAAAAPHMNPALDGCILDHGDSLERARNGMRHPATCAEVRSVSAYLDARGINADSTDEEVRDALNDMQVGANQYNNGRARAPCRNCSQFYANLMARYGAPQPSQIAEGYRSARGGQPTRFTPPRDGQAGWGSYQDALDHYNSTH